MTTIQDTRQMSSLLDDNSSDEDWMNLLQDISHSSDDEDEQPSKYKDMRSILDENVINNIDLEVQVTNTETIKYNFCTKCNVECKISDGLVVCMECGLERDVVDDVDKISFSVDKDHNTSDN